MDLDTAIPMNEVFLRYLFLNHRFMKYIKIAGIILILAIVGFCLYVAINGSSTYLEGRVQIAAPASVVFEEINNFRTYNAWSVMNNLDSTTVLTYEGSPTGLGAKRTWYNEAPKVWNGSMEIVESVPHTSIVIELMVDSNRDGDNYNDLKTPAIIRYQLSEKDGVTDVLRSISFTELEGINKLRGTFINYMIGDSFRKGLVALKERIENKPAFTKEITITSMPEINFLYNEVSCSPEKFSEARTSTVNELKEFMNGRNILANGYPITQFQKYTPSLIQMRCGFPVSTNVPIIKKYGIGKSESGSVIRVIHVGAHSDLSEAHKEANDYINYYLHEVVGSPYEVYFMEGDIQSDSSQWITHVFYPIK